MVRGAVFGGLARADRAARDPRREALLERTQIPQGQQVFRPPALPLRAYSKGTN